MTRPRRLGRGQDDAQGLGRDATDVEAGATGRAAGVDAHGLEAELRRLDGGDVASGSCERRGRGVRSALVVRTVGRRRGALRPAGTEEEAQGREILPIDLACFVKHGLGIPDGRPHTACEQAPPSHRPARRGQQLGERQRQRTAHPGLGWLLRPRAAPTQRGELARRAPPPPVPPVKQKRDAPPPMTTRSYSPPASVAMARRKLTLRGETLRPAFRGRQSAGDWRRRRQRAAADAHRTSVSPSEPGEKGQASRASSQARSERDDYARRRGG